MSSKRGSAEWKAKISAANRGRRCGPAGEFKPGHVPWNKALRGIHLSRASEFKKGEPLRGQAARKWKAVRAVTTRRDKSGRRRRFIKVRDDGPPQRRYIPLARYLYQLQRGPVPANCFVVHRDGNTLNDDLGNLMLMDCKHLIAWQKSIRPGMEPKRRKNAARSQELRGRIYRFRKAAVPNRDRKGAASIPNRDREGAAMSKAEGGRRKQDAVSIIVTEGEADGSPS